MERVYVGIDWADDHHDIHVTDDSAVPLGSFSIPHSYDGMKKLRERLGKSSSDPGNVLVTVESHQGLLIYALLEARYLVYPINPKAMDRYRDRYRMSFSKSDPKDAMVLANILRTDLHLYKPLPRETAVDARLRQLTRSHKSLGQQKTKLLNQLTTQLKSYYPVALRLFSRLDHKITLAFLECYPTPEKAAAASLEDLRKFFQKQGYSQQWKVTFIYESSQQPSLRAPKELEEVHQTIVLNLVPVIRSFPVTRRSGKTNKHLRAAFQDLARESVKQCAWARQYFAEQMRLGHKPSRAYRALANRWAAIIWKMLQERERFNQSRLDKSQLKAMSAQRTTSWPRRLTGGSISAQAAVAKTTTIKPTPPTKPTMTPARCSHF